MTAELKGKKCIIISNNLKSQFISKGFGFKKDSSLEIDLYESFYLLEKKKIKIIKENKEINLKDFEKYVNKHIKNFNDKYLVYKDFKEKGFIVKDGAIFGFDFRIYENSKNHQHTKYVVDVKRTHKDEMTKIIKSERLANSINTKYVIAIIDMEEKITKIKLERI